MFISAISDGGEHYLKSRNRVSLNLRYFPVMHILNLECPIQMKKEMCQNLVNGIFNKCHNLLFF